jgi:hypothetical protein
MRDEKMFFVGQGIEAPQAQSAAAAAAAAGGGRK